MNRNDGNATKCTIKSQQRILWKPFTCDVLTVIQYRFFILFFYLFLTCCAIGRFNSLKYQINIAYKFIPFINKKIVFFVSYYIKSFAYHIRNFVLLLFLCSLKLFILIRLHIAKRS